MSVVWGWGDMFPPHFFTPGGQTMFCTPHFLTLILIFFYRPNLDVACLQILCRPPKNLWIVPPFSETKLRPCFYPLAINEFRSSVKFQGLQTILSCHNPPPPVILFILADHQSVVQVGFCPDVMSQHYFLSHTYIHYITIFELLEKSWEDFCVGGEGNSNL